uniref:Uncharacterized protein n=1 Tax=Tanacetum cinerariifolium TaxID=118510 RepID=A0A699HQJ3_TANCI|nr:hypothetical protein [Tanacetum cinerariifolium]
MKEEDKIRSLETRSKRVSVVCSGEAVVEMITRVMLVRSDDGVGACRWGDAGGGVGCDVAAVRRGCEDVMAVVDLWCGDGGGGCVGS